MANRKKGVYKPKPMTEGKRNLIRKRLIFRYDRKIPDYFSVAGAS